MSVQRSTKEVYNKIMKKRLLILALAGITAVTALSGCSLKGDEEAVTVGDTVITADAANFYARYTQAQYETYYSAYLGEDMWNSEASEGKTYEESVKSSVQESLETMVLLEQHMSEYDISLSDAEKKVIEDTAKEFDEANSLEDKEMVSGEKKAVERVLTLMAIQQRMREAIEAGADTEVSDEEAAQKSMDYVFFSYTAADESGESKELSDDEKKELKDKAEKLAKKLKDGGDFAALAKEAETEVKTAAFDSETEAPDAGLIKAADALKEGEATDVIETDTGCYVAKVTSLLDREATDSKKESIVSDRKTELYNTTVDKWREDAKITVHEDVWKKISFKDLTVTMKTEEEMPYTDDVKTDDQADEEDEAEEDMKE